VRAAWAAGERSGKHANYTRSSEYTEHTRRVISPRHYRTFHRSALPRPPRPLPHRKRVGHTKRSSAHRGRCSSCEPPRESVAFLFLAAAALVRRRDYLQRGRTSDVGGGAWAVARGRGRGERLQFNPRVERIRHSASAAAASGWPRTGRAEFRMIAVKRRREDRDATGSSLILQPLSVRRS
jgi:hypothetical protein